MAASALSKLVRIDFYYDLISPYSCLAFEILQRYKSPWQLNLVLKPVLMGPIVSESGNAPLYTVPNKIRYITKDLTLLGKYYGMPMQFRGDVFLNAVEEKQTLRLQRFLTSISVSHPACLEPVSRDLFRRFWIQGEDIYSDPKFEKTLERAQMSQAEIDHAIQNISDTTVKQKLKENTDEALEHGAFGLPVLIVHTPTEKHMIFGGDRFHIIADLIGKPWLGPFPSPAKL